MATRRSNEPRSATHSSTSVGSSETSGAEAKPTEGAGKRAVRRRSSGRTQTEQHTSAPARVGVSTEARQAMISESAYLRAERRGFCPGYELEDWLAAEREIDALLSAGQSAPPQ